MNTNTREARPQVFIAMLGLAVLFRLFPFLLISAGYELNENYPWSFSPMLPVCLFGAAFVGVRSIALLGPMMAWLAGDVAIGLILGSWSDAFYASQMFTYFAIAACVTAGFWLRGRANVASIVGMGLATPILFFLITNFGSWLMSGMYPRTLAGLTEAYVMGIPFFRYALLSQIVFLPILFSPLALRRPAPAIRREIAL